MSWLIEKFKTWRNQASTAVTLQSPGWLSSWGSGGVPLFGNGVSEETAMAVAAVYRCVTLISGVVASLDLGIYENDPTEGQVSIENKISRLLTVKPHPGRQMTSYIWKEMLVTNLLLHGNAYSVIRYDQAGRVAALEYVLPWQVTVVQRSGRNWYVVNWNNGNREAIAQEDMLHFPGPGFDGITGQSRIRANMRNSVAMARSIQETMGKAFDNAVAPKTVTKLAKPLSDHAKTRMQAFLDSNFGGRANFGRNLILDPGSEFEVLNISMVDLAMIDAMKINGQQICSFFGVPPVLVGLDSTTTWGTGIEQVVLGFLRFTLNSDLERIEAELTSKLCLGRQYMQFDRDQLLAMDAKSAAEVMSQEISCGVSTVNESRRRKNRATVEYGDIPLVNSANISLERAVTPQQTQEQQAQLVEAEQPKPLPAPATAAAEVKPNEEHRSDLEQSAGSVQENETSKSVRPRARKPRKRRDPAV